MNNLRFAILGCGHIAEKMAKAVKALEQKNLGVELYAVAAREPEKAKRFAESHGAAKSYGNYKNLAADPFVDLIYIATPHSLHYEHALLCIEAGRNILVEKAFCANAKQAAGIIAKAKDKGVFLCEAMWTRFLPAIHTLRSWIETGRIGKVQSVEADFSMNLTHIERLVNPSLAGGALLDLGIYSLTFADLFLNESEQGIANIDARCIKYETGVDATDSINITYKNGQKAFLKTSMVNPTRNEGIIYGTSGKIRVMNLNDMEELQLYDANSKLVECIKPERICNCYEYEVLACKTAIENGLTECTEMTPRKTMEMMELMDTLRKQFGVTYPFEI